MRVSQLTFEGTTQEFAAVAHLFADARAPRTPVEPQGGDGATDPEGESRVPFIRRVLNRMPIPPGQLDLYRVLYGAGDRTLTGGELAANMGRPIDKLNGVLGALGRRVNETPGAKGKEGICALLEVHNADGNWHYRMRPELRQALEEEGIVEVA